MGTKLKGIYKGFKYISQIFRVKEREMEIGYPTDVKHVAHVGWDSHSSNAPTWMNEFKTTSDFSATSLNNLCETSNHSTWSSQDFEQSMGCLPSSEMLRRYSSPPTDRPKIPKKHKRKKTKSSSSSSPKSSSRSSRASKSKSTYTVAEVEPKTKLLGIMIP